MMDDEMVPATTEDTVLAQRTGGTDDEIGVDPGIVVTAIAATVGEIWREALVATDITISEGTLRKGKDTVTVLAPHFETEIGIDPEHHLFADLEEIAGMIAKTPEYRRMVQLSQGHQIGLKTRWTWISTMPGKMILTK